MIETRFKQTEVGLIPVEWDIKQLSTLFRFISNNTISRENLVNQGEIMNVHYGDILIKYGSILDIERNEVPFIDNKVLRKCRINEFAKDGDVFIADTAEDDLVCKATELYNIKRKKLVSGLHTIWLRPNTFFQPKYLGYFFNSAFYHNQILPLIQGTKVSSVSKRAIKDTWISIPRIEEQQKIASALTSIDNLLLSLDKLIEKKKLIKQGALQELVTGKKRLSGFKGEWKSANLGELCIIKDGTHQTPNYVENGIPFYSVENVTNNNFKSVKNITVKDHQLLTKNYQIEKGDVLMTRIGSIGVCKYIDWDVKASFYVSLALLKFKEKSLAKFFVFYSQTEDFIKDIESKSLQYATPKKINLGNISLVKIKIPFSTDEQKAIASVLTSMEKEIESLEAKKDKYISIKKGMMQQLLTGKVRLI